MTLIGLTLIKWQSYSYGANNSHPPPCLNLRTSLKKIWFGSVARPTVQWYRWYDPCWGYGSLSAFIPAVNCCQGWWRP